MCLFLAASLLLFISSPWSVLAATQELTKLGRVRLYPLKGKFLMRLQNPTPSLYLLSTFPLYSRLFSSCLSFCVSLVSLFSLQTETSGQARSCCCRHFAPDKPSRCPSFPPFLYPNLPYIHPPYNAPLLFLLGPPSSQPQPLLCFTSTPPLYVCFSGKVSDMSSGCRRRLQQAPLLLLHAMKLTPSNQRLGPAKILLLYLEYIGGRQEGVCRRSSHLFLISKFKRKMLI